MSSTDVSQWILIGGLVVGYFCLLIALWRKP